MKSKEAFLDTLIAIRASHHAWDVMGTSGHNPCSITHMEDMYSRMIAEDYSEGKTNRWLGYIQGVAVALNVLTLDQCKEINKNRAED